MSRRTPPDSRDPKAFAGLTMRLNRRPACHLCGEPVAPEEREEFDGQGADYDEKALLYWEDGAPILAIHRACGDEDNAARAEAAHFARADR
jgi:hypothetical protein